MINLQNHIAWSGRIFVHEKQRNIIVRDSFEKIQNFEWIENVDQTTGQHGLQLLVVLDHVIVLCQLLEEDFAGLLLRPVLLVADLQQAALLDHAVERAAVVTGRHLFAEIDYFLPQIFLGQIRQFSSFDLFSVGGGYGRFEQDSAAVLADALQHVDGRSGKQNIKSFVERYVCWFILI